MNTAIMAASIFFLPFLTADIIKISTMSCKTPTVMQCPDNRDIMLFQVSKEQLYLQVKTVDIMQMHKIRLHFGKPAQELFRYLL